MERISSTAGRSEELFDPAGQLLGHFNGANGIWWEQYVQFDGRLLWYYTQATNVSRYFHVNALGSLGLATDQTGAPVEEMLDYPFGGEWVNTAGFGWDEKFARFPQHDTDLGLYETAFRQYSPGLGRWLTPDKLAGDVTNPQSLDRYTYALNNPVSFTDPSGLSCIHTDDGTTVDNGDGKGCSEMNNTPQEVNVSGSGPGSIDTSSLSHLASLGSSGGVTSGSVGVAGAYIYSAPPPAPKKPADTRQSCGSVYLNALAGSNTTDQAETAKQVAEAGAGAAVAESLNWQMERLLVVPLRSPYVRLFENTSSLLVEMSEVVPIGFATYSFVRADFAVAKARVNGACRPGF